MPGFVLPRLIVRGYSSTRSSGLRFQEFDAVYSENGVSSQETSFLVAQLKGREVGRIRSQLDAPDVDKRFLGAATARAGKLLHYHTFLALIGDDIDKSEEALAEPSSTKLDSAPSSSTYCALSSSTCTVATGENDEGRNTLLQSSTDWEVTLVRFREDGAAVQGCDAGSSLSNFYDICFFSLLSRPIGSFAFVNWGEFSVVEPALKTKLRVYNNLCDSVGSTKAISIHIIGDRWDSAGMGTAPLLMKEALQEHSRSGGCTWRSLSSALYAAEPLYVKNKLRACGKRIAGLLREEAEPTSLAEFADRLGRMRKMPLSLSKVKATVLLPRTNAKLIRMRMFRERAMLDWVFENNRSGIYIMQVVDSVGYSGHVVTIDTNRRLVYDSFLQHPLRMNERGTSSPADTVMFFCCGGRLTCRGVRNVYKLTERKESLSK